MHKVQFPGCPPWLLHQGYGHGERIFDVAFHPFSDDLVLTASEDSSVRMWRRPDGSAAYKQVRAFLGHSGEALRACWSANGLLLASGSADRTVRLWAADLNDPGYTGRQLAVLDGHPEEVYHVELVNPAAPPPDLAAVRRAFGATAGGGGDPAGGPLPPFETHVLVASSESLFVWSLQEGAVMQQADAPGTSGSTITQDAIMAGARPAYIFGVSRQPRGTLVAAVCCDGVVRLWSLRPTGQLEWAGQVALPGQPMLTGCAFAADGSLLGVCSRDGRLLEVDVRTLELLSSRPLPSSPLAVAYLPAGATAAAAAGAGAGAGADGQQPLWLVACRDGAVYGYLTGQQATAAGGGGGGPACVLRPPAGPDVAVLAVAVSPGGTAVALGGEAQDAALLPPIQPQTSRAPTRPDPEPTAAAASAAAPEPARAESTSGGGDASSGGAASGPQIQRPAARAATAAPPRRRRGGGAERVVAGGLATRDPLAFFDGGGSGDGGDDGLPTATAGAAQADRDTNGVVGELEAMKLTEPVTAHAGHAGSQSGPAVSGPIVVSAPASKGDTGATGVAPSSPPAPPQQPQAPQHGEGERMGEPAGTQQQQEQRSGERQRQGQSQAVAGGGGDDDEAAGAAAGGGGGGGGVAPSGRMRAPLFVYLGPADENRGYSRGSYLPP